MSISLLDVNVLVALFDPLHTSHNDAHRWFGVNKRHGWSTCPITINGCIRVLSNPAYPTVRATPGEVAERLRDFCATPHHHFWADAISLADETLFQWPMMNGHQKVTDTYLLGLAVHYHGRLATFDRSISAKAVAGASQGHLVIPNVSLS
jgi:toxin-antitoxin system PIN domain toxin